MVNYAVVAFFLVAYIAVGVIITLPEPPLVPLLLGSVALVCGVALFFFPFSKTLWSAIDLVLHGFVLDEEQKQR